MTAPPVEERLLRALVAVRPRREALADHARAWFNASDPDTLRAAFTWDGLVPLAGGRLAALLGDDAPAWIGPWVQAETQAAARYGQFREVAEAMVLGLLAQADIAVMPLKGTRVARDLHGATELRSSGDIDLLVPTARLQDAVDVLVGAGWSPPGDPAGRDGLPRLHFALLHPGGLPPVEVHWRVSFHERTWAQDVLRRATVHQAERAPLPADLLAMLLLFFARDGFNNLRIAADIAAWWDHHGDGPMADMLASIAETPTLRRSLVTAAVAAERAVGLPAQRVLSLTADSPHCSRTALRFATAPLAPTLQQRLAERRLLDPLLAGTQRLPASLRHLLVPSVATARYLRPDHTATTAGLTTDLVTFVAMVPIRAGLAAGRLRGIAATRRWELDIDRRREHHRGGTR